MIFRTFKFRLHPTAEQDAKLRQFAGASRYIYNLALEQRRDFWRQYRAATGRHISYASQCKEVTALRAESDWIRDFPASCAEQTLQDADRAFAAFFSGSSSFPSFRSKERHTSFRYRDGMVSVRPINKRWAVARLPKVGLVKFRLTRLVRGDIRQTTIKLEPEGWFITFGCAIEHEPSANDGGGIGIDRGIALSLCFSNGEEHRLPIKLRDMDRRARRSQRALARCKRGSKRRAKAKMRTAKLKRRVARVRREWLHTVSTSVARRFGHVALEDLNISNMTASGPGKRGLNRSILEQGWGSFASMLKYKLAERGGALVLVDPAYTSQTCSACGVIDRKSRKSQASFVCTSCGTAMNADHNAAINIFRRSTSAKLVEGGGYAPVEARTCRVAA